MTQSDLIEKAQIKNLSSMVSHTCDTQVIVNLTEHPWSSPLNVSLYNNLGEIIIT